MKDGCPVLRELAVTEDYDREHEQAPVLSGGDYDISAIRDCAEHCTLGRIIYAQRLQLDNLRRLLRVANTEPISCLTAGVAALVEELDKLRARVEAEHPDTMSASVSGLDATKGEK